MPGKKEQETRKEKGHLMEKNKGLMNRKRKKGP